MGGFIILITAAFVHRDPLPDPVVLERQAVEARMAIRTLHIKLTLEQEWHDTQDQKEKIVEVKQFEIWLDETHYRADIFTEGAPSPRNMAVGRRHVLCRNCERPGHSIQYLQNSGVALMRSNSPLGHSNFADGSEAFDPRLLGYTHDHHNNMPRPASAKNLGLEISSPELTPPTVEAATVDGEASWVLKNKWIRSGVDHRVYVVPTKGGSIGLIESSSRIDGESYSSRHHSELERDERSGIWFPKRFVREVSYDGKPKDRGTVTVHLREFNQPIDPAVFSLAGMNLPDGVEVYDPNLLPPGAPRPRLQYRDGQILPYQEKTDQTSQSEVVGQPRPVDPSVVPGRYRRWYAAAAVAFGIAAALLIRRAVRRSTGSRELGRPAPTPPTP